MDTYGPGQMDSVWNVDKGYQGFIVVSGVIMYDGLIGGYNGMTGWRLLIASQVIALANCG